MVPSPGLYPGPFVKVVYLILLIAPLTTPALGHLLVKVSVDFKDCKTYPWNKTQEILTSIIRNHSELPLNGTGKHCGCHIANVSGCSKVDKNRAEETLIYYTQNDGIQLESLNSSLRDQDRLLHSVPVNETSGIVCVYVLEATVNDVQNCYRYEEQDNSSSTFQFSVQGTSTAGPEHSARNAAVIGGAVAGGLAGLGLLAALATLLYRKLKQAAQVSDSALASDVTPIIPADLGITEAPNSVAPAGT